MMIAVVAGLATLILAVVFMPALELLPAQVFPQKRVAGESMVPGLPGAMDLYKAYGKFGIDTLKALPAPQVSSSSNDGDKTDVEQAWKAKLIEINGPEYAPKVEEAIKQNVGSPEDLKNLLTVLQTDKNYIYNAYGLFLGLSLFAGALAIQAMGRWGAEEKTILPAKK